MKDFVIPKYIYATKNTRAINFIIDIIIIKLLTSVVLIIIDNIKQEYSLMSWYDSLDVYELYLFSSATMFVYYFLTENFLSRSLSKFITNTIVIKDDGTKPNTIDILARSVLRIIPFEYFTFLRGRKPGMHDEYSNTFVVQKNKFKKSIKEFNEMLN
ncbi:RDD family protein [Flavobacterium sp.]|uniref:RDD family protein n=1 Tax=Flavobacterium sp. TaxID=239 RepID=UPI00286A2D31|nr:RDD family protein [Flavobacterium sp.]